VDYFGNHNQTMQFLMKIRDEGRSAQAEMKQHSKKDFLKKKYQK